MDILWESLDWIQKSIEHELEQAQDKLENVMAWMVYLHKVLRQTKQKANKKVFCVFKKIAAEMANYKTYEKLSKDKEMNTYLNALLKVFLQKFISISPNQIN